MSAGALDGLRILEWGELVSAPYCGKLVADMGAEVIKVEPPRQGDKARWLAPFFQDIPGPDRSGLFLYLNTNKLGITLDPSKPLGRQLFLDLVAQVDVVIENQPMGYPDSIGMGYEALHQASSNVVLLTISPFGASGPYRDYQATDLTIAHMSGFGYPQPGREEATPDRPPLRPGGRQTDFNAGLTAAVAMMHGLFQRQASGEGSYVDVSALEATAIVSASLGAYLDDGPVLRRVPTGTAAETTWVERLPTKDGYLNIQSITYQDWQALAEIMGNPQWAQGEQFQDVSVRAEYFRGRRPELWEWTRTQEKQKLYHALQRRRMVAMPINTAEDLLNSEQLNTRGFFVEVNTPETGPLKYPGAPAKYSKTPWSIRRPAPSLGQHNREVFCERLGLAGEKLVELAAAGVI